MGVARHCQALVNVGAGRWRWRMVSGRGWGGLVRPALPLSWGARPLVHGRTLPPYGAWLLLDTMGLDIVGLFPLVLITVFEL